jgi:hypothetical protein
MSDCVPELRNLDPPGCEPQPSITGFNISNEESVTREFKISDLILVLGFWSLAFELSGKAVYHNYHRAKNQGQRPKAEDQT